MVCVVTQRFTRARKQLPTLSELVFPLYFKNTRNVGRNARLLPQQNTSLEFKVNAKKKRINLSAALRFWRREADAWPRVVRPFGRWGRGEGHDRRAERPSREEA